MRTKNVIPITDPDAIRKILLVDNGPSVSHTPIGWGAGATPDDSKKLSSQSLTLHCTKCKSSTAGIYLHPADKVRRCIVCHSLLMYCPVCQSCTSAREKFSVLSCDNCLTDFVTNTTVEYLASRDRTAREIVLSGIRATGALHLGNLLGAVQQFVEYEHGDNLCMYFIADWHTLTTLQDPQKVTLNSLAIATDYLAAGLNPEKSIIYSQSSVPEIAELALYLSMIQSKNQLEDLPTVKALARDGKYLSLGHLHYPVLMAADILGPKATLVPVGKDQVPNVELARGLAERFNRQFGTTFVIPRMSINKIIPGLAGGKMAKSEGDSSLTLTDTRDTISEKYLKRGITDTGRRVKNDPGNPNNCVSVYPVYQALLEQRPDDLQIIADECRSGIRDCKACKLQLAQEIDTFISPFRERKAKLAQQKKYVEEVLHYGNIKAREIIRTTVEEVREKMGIILT